MLQMEVYQSDKTLYDEVKKVSFIPRNTHHLFPHNSDVCPKCGYCPHCGRSGHEQDRWFWDSKPINF